MYTNNHRLPLRNPFRFLIIRNLNIWVIIISPLKEVPRREIGKVYVLGSIAYNATETSKLLWEAVEPAYVRPSSHVG